MANRRNQYVHATIENIIEHSETMRSFVLDELFYSKPGQFAMVWLPGIDEKPISLSRQNTITVKQVGPWTKKLFEKSEGQYLDIRGPYGNGFPSPQMRPYTLIGGGCGIAPLFYFFANSEICPQSFVLAGKSKKDLIFLDDLEDMIKEQIGLKTEIITATEDGSHGVKGLATDAEIPKWGGNYYLCGPEIMMKKVAEKLVNIGAQPEDIFLSIERYMKCAVGVCGNCSFSGYRVCADGPVFRYDKIKDLPHFNRYHRTKTGELMQK